MTRRGTTHIIKKINYEFIFSYIRINVNSLDYWELYTLKQLSGPEGDILWTGGTNITQTTSNRLKMPLTKVSRIDVISFRKSWIVLKCQALKFHDEGHNSREISFMIWKRYRSKVKQIESSLIELVNYRAKIQSFRNLVRSFRAV